MNNNKGFRMEREALRALTHAQGQLVDSHKDMLLFFALDALVHITQNPQIGALENISPATFADAKRLGGYLDNISQRQAMLVWDVNEATSACNKGLKDIVRACNEAAPHAPEDRAALEYSVRLAQATADYLDMAAAIRRPDLTDTFKRATKIDPYTSATFLHAYIERLTKDPALTKADPKIAAKLAAQSEEIAAYLPGPAAAIYEIGPDKICNLYKLMDCLSETADTALSLKKAAQREKIGGEKLQQSLLYTFSTAAVYDWRQYQQPANSNDAKAPRANNVLQFKPR